MDPDAEFHHDNGISRKRDLVARADVVDYLAPRGYARVFHPQIPLHERIADLVIFQMTLDHQARRGYAEWTDSNENTYCPK